MTENESRKTLHPIILLDYVPRVVGHILLCIVLIITIASQGREISDAAMLFVFLEALVWPHIALFLSWRSPDPKKMEYRLLLLDSLIACIWIPYVHYSFWPSITVVVATLMAILCVGGWKLGLKSLFANVVGVLIGASIFEHQVDLNSNLTISISCASVIILFSATTGYMTYYRARITKNIRNALKAVNAEKDFLIGALNASKDALEESLNELRQSKAQLVQSEKMAGIGQLVAGISHEINTPAGAIAAAIDEINSDYVTLLKALMNIVKSIPLELQTTYFEICNKTLVIPNEFNTMEIRKIASEIEGELSKNNISDCRMLCKNLASIGFHAENVDEMMPLISSEFRSEIFESIFMLGMTRIHTRDIKIAIEKILSLVKALKLFSRSDQEQYTCTDLHEDMDTTLMILKNRLKQGVTVIKEFDVIPKVECIAERLNQVWLNMINNAIEAMKGKGTIIIRIKPYGDEHVCIEFEDNGPGIPSDVLPRIFEAYYTTKPKGEGTGLGLYISHDIITHHGGSIDIETSEKGTLFRIVIPIKETIKNEQPDDQETHDNLRG